MSAKGSRGGERKIIGGFSLCWCEMARQGSLRGKNAERGGVDGLFEKELNVSRMMGRGGKKPKERGGGMTADTKTRK